MERLAPADELEPQIARLGALMKAMQSLQNREPSDPHQLHSKAVLVRPQLVTLRLMSQRLASSFANAEEYVQSNGAGQDAEQLRAVCEQMIKDREAQSRSDRFAIQDLMSGYNPAETLTASIKKKKDGTANAIAQTLG